VVEKDGDWFGLEPMTSKDARIGIKGTQFNEGSELGIFTLNQKNIQKVKLTESKDGYFLIELQDG